MLGSGVETEVARGVLALTRDALVRAEALRAWVAGLIHIGGCGQACPRAGY